MNMRSFIILGAAAALTSGTAAAQPVDYKALEQLFGEPVTTSVTGSPQRASDAPASMQIVTADQIRRSGARDIPGVLRHFAGVDVLRWTNDQADVALRGYDQAFSPRLLVLVNGRQVYADYYGFTPWSTIPVQLDEIRQIEIVKGPADALFGFNAVAGVINIITYDPRESAVRDASVTLGTQADREGSAVASLKFGRAGAMRVSGGLRRDDGFSTPLQPADIGTRRGNRRAAADVDAYFAPTDRVHFGVELTYSGVRQAEIPPTYTMSYTHYRTHSIRTDWSADTRIGLIQANLYRNSITADAYMGAAPAPLFVFDNDVTVAQLQDVFQVGARHVLRVSADYRYSTMPTTPIQGARVHYGDAAVAGMWNWKINESLAWTNAVRVDDWHLGRSGYLPPDVAALGLSNAAWDRTERPVSANSGLVWHSSAATTWRFMAGRGFQLPNLLDLGGRLLNARGFTLAGAPWLDFADTTTYEVAWARRLRPSGIMLRASLYRGRTDDVLSSFYNLDVSKTAGAELSAEGKVGSHWRWSASYTPQRIHDRFSASLPFAYTYVDFQDTTPRQTLNGHAGWSSGPWEVDGYLRYESRFDGIRGPNPGQLFPTLVPIPSHVTMDARVAYRFSDRLRLAISGQNLTEPVQRQTSGPLVERRVLAKVTAAF